MDTTVAQTILAQLGGRRFLAMTGARQLIGGDDHLSFTLPGKPGYVKHGINVCRITLTPMDVYTVEYLRVREGKVRTVQTCEEVYAEDLQDCFSRETGLSTRL
jgi:hypothetical protein